MRFETVTSPHISADSSVARIMRRVLYALLPGTLAYLWFFGWGLLFNLLVAIGTAVVAEAVMVRLRNRPVAPVLGDYSAVVTAWLLALALPNAAPWWIAVVGTLFAIVVAKQLYGGLGFNPFNPAMVGYVALLVSFPKEMTQWVAPRGLVEESHDLLLALEIFWRGGLADPSQWDALTMATPLDTVKTGLAMSQTLGELTASPLFGDMGAAGWEWIANFYLLGGLYLLYRRVIAWQIPVGVLAGLLVSSSLFFAFDPDVYSTPAFHLFSGGAILGAFFIATDPVSAATTPRGRLIYGAGIGILTFIIRTWGGYPDGVAFAVLLMNLTVPTIDHYTQPRLFGAGKRAPVNTARPSPTEPAQAAAAPVHAAPEQRPDAAPSDSGADVADVAEEGDRR